jgi:hypothetical protein
MWSAVRSDALDADEARITMTETTNKRSDKRIPTELELFYYARRVDAVGVLANISYSGALIEDTRVRPKIGSFVVLYVHLEPPSAFAAETPFEVVGHVVRHSPAGFAIEYKDNPDVRRMVDDAAAIVAVPR